MKIQTILRGIRQADNRFGLIRPGDKIAVAVSGGKDSMLLLTALRQYQKFPHTDFELVGIHVDVGFEEFDHDLMTGYCRDHDLPLYIEKTRIFPILELDKNRGTQGQIQCSLCSKLKKGVLFETAKKLGCNKVAFGHHADDAIETFFLNMIHGSKAATFQPLQYMSRMDMDLIRPLVLLRESEIVQACQDNGIPSVRRVCPNDGFTQRQSIKDDLEEVYRRYPMARDNFLTVLSNCDEKGFWHDADSENVRTGTVHRKDQPENEETPDSHTGPIQ